MVTPNSVWRQPNFRYRWCRTLYLTKRFAEAAAGRWPAVTEQRALDIAAQLTHETQALSDDLDIGLRQGEGHERELLALGQVAGETVDADSFAASPFQRDNNDISNRVSRSEPDRVEFTRKAQQRLLQ